MLLIYSVARSIEETEEGQSYEILFRKLVFTLLIYSIARSIEETEEGQNYEILVIIT